MTGLAWSPDGRTLASTSLDETVRLWRSDGTLINTLQPHAGRTFAAAWSPDGKILATAAIISTLNPTVQLWNVQGQVVKTLSTSFSGGKFYNLAWTPDGQYLAGGATDYKIWRVDGTQVFWLESSEHATPAWAMAWSPDGQAWAVGDENGTVRIFRPDGTPLAEIQDQSSVNSLAWSLDGRKIAGAKTLWSADGKVINPLNDQSPYVNSAAWSPDGAMLATGGSDGQIHLWSADGRRLGLLPGHAKDIRVVAWSPDGKTLASASNDQTIRLWTLKINYPLHLHYLGSILKVWGRVKKEEFTGRILLLREGGSQISLQEVFCPNLACQASGQKGKENIGVQSQQKKVRTFINAGRRLGPARTASSTGCT